VFEYQKIGRFFAQIPEGLETWALQELTELGAAGVTPAFRGAYFNATPAVLYRVNYESRLLTRVLAPLKTFTCPDREALYRVAKALPWSQFLGPKNTFAVFAQVSENPKLKHAGFAALVVKDAIADCFSQALGIRPNVDTLRPDVWINLNLRGSRAILHFDTSGSSLHRRGYRTESVPAPMQETVAAAVIRVSGWDGDSPLYDPMCGSGTLLSEALMRYCRLPAGMLRKRFGFQCMPDFDPALWQTVREAAQTAGRPLPEGLIGGSDISGQAVSAARANLANLPYRHRVRLKTAPFENLRSLENQTIVCNPPYGIRLGRPQEMAPLYRALGDFLKQRCKGSQAYIFVGDRELLKYVGLKPSLRQPIKSGGLDGRLVKYELY
jgi:putative N6-adenine-specific DNA methylase